MDIPDIVNNKHYYCIILFRGHVYISLILYLFVGRTFLESHEFYVSDKLW